MSAQPETPAAQGLIRDAIAFPRLPWVRPLIHACATNFDAVARLFPGNPASPADWSAAITRVAPAARHRTLIRDVIARQQALRSASEPARAATDRLARPDSVAVVTGQQAGLFGGPLYTLLKALTTLHLARTVEAAHGVPVVPVFWVDAEDHDWEEVRTAHVLDRDGQLVDITLAPLPGCGTRPVAQLTLDAGIETALAQVEQHLPPTEFTAGLLESLRRRYVPGASLSGAFAGWLEDLLGPLGLVVFESADPTAKPAVADLFAAEFQAPGRTARLAREGGAALSALGHAPQIDPAEDVVCLFHLADEGRQPIRVRDGAFVIGNTVRDSAGLVAEALAHPERFSPNVLLRPLVQDRLFPTVGYVGGPSEIAYQAQLSGVYRAFGVEAPLLCSRVSVTLLDSAAQRFLEKQQVPFEMLQPQDESALNRLLQNQLPAAVEQAIQAATASVTAEAARLKEAVAQVDPTLAGAVETTVDKVRDTLATLHSKIVQAAKKKDETTRRQFTRARGLAFPGGQPQERLLAGAFFLNRYGTALPERLVDALPALPERHYLLVP